MAETIKNENQFFTGKQGILAYAQQNPSMDEISIPRGKAESFQTINGGPRTFLAHDTNISVRSDYYRGDYDYFRPTEKIPGDPRNALAMCCEAYDKNGIVHNIIDLMSEFATYGIKLQHPRKTTENFYTKWFKNTVRGPETSCAFVRLLLKTANVIVKRNVGKISVLDETAWKRSISQDLDIEKIKVNKRDIPVRYTFINPLAVDVIGGELANFIGKPLFELYVPISLSSALSHSNKFKEEHIQALINTIPKDLLKQLKSGARTIPLDPEKIEVFYYKKEDWQTWAYPITYSILNDLIMLEKTKLADISALDGAISNIRLWRFGILDGVNSILPTASAINKLRNILANNVGGGVLDLVWGPELDFKESATEVHRFLGSDKYKPTLDAIYDGFGVPPTLRSGGSSGTNTGNSIGLNTMIKRLQYVRDILMRFWVGEIQRVHKAMGFKGPLPRIVFDNMVLADEAAEKQLLIHLWDRNIIPTESVVEIFGRVPEVEKARVISESKDMSIPDKASPYHNPEKDHDLKKILLQGGDVTPSEVGVELEEKNPNEKSRVDKNQENQLKMKEAAKPNVGSPGRPKNITETEKRKPKPAEKPKANLLDLSIWAANAQEKISKIANPAFLHVYGKGNMRQLTKSEVDKIERIKFNILCNLEQMGDVNTESVIASMNKSTSVLNAENKNMFDIIKSNFISINNREPKISELRQIFINTYVMGNSNG